LECVINLKSELKGVEMELFREGKVIIRNQGYWVKNFSTWAGAENDRKQGSKRFTTDFFETIITQMDNCGYKLLSSQPPTFETDKIVEHNCKEELLTEFPYTEYVYMRK